MMMKKKMICTFRSKTAWTMTMTFVTICASIAAILIFGVSKSQSIEVAANTTEATLMIFAKDNITTTTTTTMVNIVDDNDDDNGLNSTDLSSSSSSPPLSPPANRTTIDAITIDAAAETKPNSAKIAAPAVAPSSGGASKNESLLGIESSDPSGDEKLQSKTSTSNLTNQILIETPKISINDSSVSSNISETNHADQIDPKEPWDIMSSYVRNRGGVIVHFILLAYVCMALGIVCDIYFLSSLEFISNGLRLPSDIAGATFMAMGTSAPELFTSLIGVFISEDDIGTGTILGSAVFNIIFIPAVCGFAVWRWCDSQPKVSKFAILRDTIFYLITITSLLLAMKDNEIDWIESMAMLGLFAIYLIIMYFNAQIGEMLAQGASETKYEALESSNQRRNSDEHTPLLLSAQRKQSNKKVSNSLNSNHFNDWNGTHEIGVNMRQTSHDADAAEDDNNRDDRDAMIITTPNGTIPIDPRRRYSSLTEEGELDDDNWIETNPITKWIMLPALIAFRLTLPKPTKYCFAMTFLVSILWISVLTYAAVWLVQIISYTLTIPDTIAGLTLLAAGTSIPELISSVLVVKRAGLADMALCNSIGSNIFDILVCLGLPWLLKSIVAMIDGGTIDPALTIVPIRSEGLPFTTFALLLTVVGLLGTLSMFKWRLGVGVGVVCTIIYVVFLVLSSLFEIYYNY